MTEKRKFYGMRNDYMFHAVLQKNEEVLRNLLATLLEMDEADIVSCRIENPIELGREIKGKECILDAKIILNDARIINIELQVYKQTYWVNRSLLYWSRAYDSIKSGQEYDRLLPTYNNRNFDFTICGGSVTPKNGEPIKSGQVEIESVFNFTYVRSDTNWQK